MLAIVTALRDAKKRLSPGTDGLPNNDTTGVLGGLYGDLELSSSTGHTQTCYPCFLAPTLLAYVSGSVLNLLDVAPAASASASAASLKPITCKAVITAVASSQRDGVLAIAERGKLNIKLFRWPGGMSLGHALQVPHGDLSIRSLAFSPDGRYLASLGDIPTFQVCLFDWKSGNLIASATNDGPASLLSFDPQDPTVMVTSGERIGVTFYSIEASHRKANLRVTKSKDFNDNPLLSLDVELAPNKQLASHTWTPDANLLIPSHDGEAVLLYNSRTGDQREFVHANTSDPEAIPNKIKVIAVCSDGAIMGCQDGKVHWIGIENGTRVLKSVNVDSSGISSLVHSPDYRRLAIGCTNGSIFNYDVESQTLHTAVDGCSNQMSGFGVLSATDMCIVVLDNGTLQFFDDTVSKRVLCADMHGAPSSIATSPYSPLFATASKAGVLRIYNALKADGTCQPSLLYRGRLHSGNILTASFDPIGRYIATLGEDGKIFLCDVSSKVQPVGYFAVPGTPVKLAWSVDEGAESQDVTLYMYILTTDSKTKLSVIHRFQLPVDENPIKASAEDKLLLVKQALDPVIYNADEEWRDFTVSWGQLTGYREVFYAMSADRCLKAHNGRTRNNGPALDETIVNNVPVVLLGNALAQFSNHEKTENHVALSPSLSWVLTWSADGFVTVRSVLDLDQALVVSMHDAAHGGVIHAQFSRDQRTLYTVGRDGIVRTWEWKYSANGRRAAAETEDELEEFEKMQVDYVATVMETLSKTPVVDDIADSDSEKPIWEMQQNTQSSKSIMAEEIEEYKNSLKARATSIRDRITECIQKNENLPAAEKLEKSEFVIDFARRDKMIAEIEEKVSRARAEAEEENLKTRALRNKLKREVWDSMEVPGEVIRSFNPSKLTLAHFEINNYSVRKRSAEELARINRVILMRRTQLVMNAAIKVSGSNENEVYKLQPWETVKHQDLPDVSKLTTKQLLYDPTELTSVEKRVQQILLLSEVALDVKMEFNARFREVAKTKRDEITRIEEKNDRIAEIMADLQIQEPIFHPSLDDAEVPERVIEVKPEEIKALRFITPEERRKLDEKRRQDEERQRAAQEDDSKARALQVMMGGKLEDRAVEDDKEELVKPAWMSSKAEADMTEDERKQVKEFERKALTRKEEQEKYRKALEAELRKLQAAIKDISMAFDDKLQEFGEERAKSEAQVLKYELGAIKLAQICAYADGGEARTSTILKRLDELRKEKTTVASEIPEIKKDLERCREDLEAAVRRDKEIERQFKREFAEHVDVLIKMFKNRDLVKLVEDDTQKSSLSPFATLETSTLVADTPLAPLNTFHLPLQLDDNMLDGISDLRERKYLAECEVKAAQKRFQDASALVQNVLDASDRLRCDVEHAEKALVQIAEEAFLAKYDLIHLIELKQGQVEVPSSAVVTDYSDAVLIPRLIIEKQNEAIVAVGKTKVDALKEMKDYRKGILMLEWQNSVLDFQAEDLTNRIRDVQLLRVTKQMQEYLRSGDEHKQASEVASIEKRAEYTIKNHAHKLDEHRKRLSKLKRLIKEKEIENTELDAELERLYVRMEETRRIYEAQADKSAIKPDPLKEIYSRRRLVEYARSQASDIAILSEEVERLRLKTYPSFPAKRP
ncbi:hypothetical protein SeMB42_g03068 [Synchytrium endobioticum]|uniref:Cilia- and flagella-associated protein 43 n=1 Tax=Synchytrium endobioticum TaxID=286115 RepID=A0A507D9J1_9FUNG|nr:hypothetical protein SeMB42_g03068 [Synchytrium endobioticum]TPX50492.1 hypothetical protein SeLEV6574_g00862 [Synchytrium endobioticum]